MFSINTRVRYQETDHGGRVYHANYLIWLDMARTEYLRSRGIDYADLERKGFFLVVRKASLEYMASPGYDEVVDVRIKQIKRSGIRVDFYYEITHNTTRKLFVEAYTQLVCIDKKGKPVKFPDELKIIQNQGEV